MIDSKEKIALVRGCQQGDKRSQEKLYKAFYPYAMSICMRYAATVEEAAEVLNDGFLKVFLGISKFNEHKSLKSWVRTIMVNTAIDSYRKNKRMVGTDSLEKAGNIQVNAQVLEQMDKEEVLLLVQELPPAYRMVFNLFVVEGYAHKEISQKLGITESTSRSHLTAANAKLRKLVTEKFAEEPQKHE